MEVFQFDKSMMDRLEEAQNVLACNKVIPASRVVDEWSYNVELLIEPAGWQAIWKISRVICEELKIKYPTTVYGTVTNVLFKDLKAIFSIIAIQDDDIHLPEEHEVPLVDLWPTKVQENSAINIEVTANCVDMVRFFFTNLWMPWDADNDEDIDWSTKYLESRIRFCYDLKTDINPASASHIRALLAEAQDIQQRREYLELDISDDEDMNDSKTQITDLMKLHVRLATIRHEIEMWENPKLRKVFEQLKFPHRYVGNISLVMQRNGSLMQYTQDLEKARKIIGDEKDVKLGSSLQECLMNCGSAGQIYLTEGPHCIKFLENLKSSIIGIEACDNSIDLRLKSDIDGSKQPVIMAKEFENILLTLAGNLKIKNVILDCRKARTGILIRDGSVHFEGCTFVGDSSSSTSTAIIMLKNTQVSVENCVIKDFSTAVAMRGSTTYSKSSTASSFSLTNSIIYNVATGVECTDQSCVSFKESKIINSTHYGIVTTSDKTKTDKLLLNEINEMKQYDIPITGDCEFNNCSPQNIVIFNKSDMCLLKNDKKTMQQIHHGEVNGVNCSLLEVENFNNTNDTAHDVSTSSDLEYSVIVIDE